MKKPSAAVARRDQVTDRVAKDALGVLSLDVDNDFKVSKKPCWRLVIGVLLLFAPLPLLFNLLLLAAVLLPDPGTRNHWVLAVGLPGVAIAVLVGACLLEDRA